METAAPAKSAATEITSAWLTRVAARSGAGGELRVARAADCESPAFADDGSAAAVVGGVLHNRTELCEELGVRNSELGARGSELGVQGSEFGVNDAALVLRAYRRWGQECPQHLRGVCAFIIWDRSRQMTFGARDRIGVYPLFWAWSGDDLIVSPSIDALLSEPHVARGLNRSAMVDHLRHTWGDHPTETFFEAVSRIPAGHAFEAHHKQLRVWPYWSVLRYDQDVKWLLDSEVEQFHDMLDRAVDRCLQFGRGAIFLSGGFDSVSIAASAVGVTRQSDSPAPLALSLAFPHPECNEEPIQRGVAAALGVKQVVMPFEQAVAPEGLIWSGLALGQQLAAPLANCWGAAYYRLRLEAQRQRCDVVMTGNGGDDWLTVDPLYIADLIRNGNVRDLAAMVRNQLRSYDLPRLALLRTLLWRYGARPLMAFHIGRALRKTAPGLLRAHRQRRRRSVSPPWLAPDPVLQRASERRFEQAQTAIDARPAPKGRYGFFHSEEPRGFIRPAMSMEFEEVFELGRRTGTLELAPYWDGDLVEFLHRIPPKVLDRGGRAKGLVRETVARRFPELGFDRQRKVSASSYFTSTLSSEAPKAWRRLGGATGLTKLGVVDTGLNDVVERAFAERDVLGMHRILDVMNLEAWARTRAA